MKDVIAFLRSWVLAKLGVKSEAAHRGAWWEVDLLIVILLGSALLGFAAWLQL